MTIESVQASSAALSPADRVAAARYAALQKLKPNLSAIAAKLSALPATGDPALDGILGEIDLRARVELAKLGRTA